MTSVGEDSLFDDIIRQSADQWASVLEECDVAGYFVCPVDIERLHWFLIPKSVLQGVDH